MTGAALRFLLMAALFVGWVAYLLFLVVTLPRSPNGLPVTVSRPQVLVSEVVVAGTLDADRREVTVGSVLTGDGPNAPKAGDVLVVENLKNCEPSIPSGDLGSCVLPLQGFGDGKTFRVVPLPPSPGYPPHPPRIYADTRDTRAQVRDIQQP